MSETNETIKQAIERELRKIDTQLQLQWTGADHMVVLTDRSGVKRTQALHRGELAWHPVAIIEPNLQGVTLYTEDQAKVTAIEMGSCEVIHWREFLLQRQSSLLEVLNNLR